MIIQPLNTLIVVGGPLSLTRCLTHFCRFPRLLQLRLIMARCCSRRGSLVVTSAVSISNSTTPWPTRPQATMTALQGNQTLHEALTPSQVPAGTSSRWPGPQQVTAWSSRRSLIASPLASHPWAHCSPQEGRCMIPHCWNILPRVRYPQNILCMLLHPQSRQLRRAGPQPPPPHSTTTFSQVT